MNVLVAIYGDHPWNLPAGHVEYLRRRFPRVTFTHAAGEQELMAHIASADVGFLGRLKAPGLARARRLRWVHSPAAGVGNLIFPEMVASDVIVTNSRGLHGAVIAEHVIGVTIALFRQFHTAVRAQLDHRWVKAGLSEIRSLRGRQMGIVGLGAVGSAVADAAAAMGMRVAATRRRPGAPRPPSVDVVYPPAQLPELLAASDVVVLAAPHTGETRDLIGSGEIRQMKRNAVLINVARGRLVREADLALELSRGTIAGAALDVFEREPLDTSSPLWDLPNVLITPHTSGFREDYWEAAVELFADNLGRFEAGEPLLNVVDKSTGY
jgi:phosphoglycerate dehydrogenase-like enzyme